MASTETLLAEYHSIAPLAERLTQGVKGQLEHLFQQEEIVLSVPIQARVKRWESIGDKLTRLKLNLTSIYDLQDLVGFRLIHHFVRDVERTAELVCDTFKVSKKYDAAGRLETDQFGYTSIHIVAKLNDAWLNLPMFRGLDNIPIEFQIRTTAQHIWAAASQLLQYKREEAVPPTVRRAIHRVSALLETVDLEFDRVLRERSAYAEAVDRTPDSEPLSADLVAQVVAEVFPANKDAGIGTYAVAIDELLAFQVDTKSKLRAVLQRHKNKVLALDRKQAVAIATKKREAVTEETVEEAKKGRFYARVGMLRLAMSEEFGEQYEDFVKKRFESNIAKKRK